MIVKFVLNAAVKLPCSRLLSSTTKRQKKSVDEVLESLSAKFEASQVPEPDLSASHLVAKVLGTNNIESIQLYKHLSDEHVAKLETYVNCRLARMPVQYIVGDWDFRSLTLKMQPPVFIPRPETEQLVGLVLRYLDGRADEHQTLNLLEVGCGSGAISLSILQEATAKVRILAVDQSEAACELTCQNLKNLGLPEEALTIVQTKIDIEEEDCGFQGMIALQSLDLIVSNPPYVLRKDLTKLADEIKV